jgi:RluA family pseudouridine synthase
VLYVRERLRKLQPLKILFEDEFLIAVDKPAGLIVHGAPDSLEESLAAQIGKRAILLHRLDRDTSGVVLLAKRKDAAGPLSRAFEEKKIRKSYFAVVEGLWPKSASRVESLIDRLENRWISQSAGNGRRALTTFRILAANETKSLLEAMPKTGRTHQIRLHCAGVGHAVCGDRIYGIGAESDPPQALHAHRIDFRHPITEIDVRILAPPPEYWASHWLNGLQFDRNLLCK